MTRPVIFAVLLTAICGCMSPDIPQSFNRLSSPGWASIEIRDTVTYEHAWNMALGILVRDFDIERADKENGYIRTGWMHTWSGVYQYNYRVRVTVKFAEDRKTLDIKSEAQAQDGDNWILGVDTRQLSTLKTDLMGTIGRTTR